VLQSDAEPLLEQAKEQLLRGGREGDQVVCDLPLREHARDL
jgi:hypothetical protein